MPYSVFFRLRRVRWCLLPAVAVVCALSLSGCGSSPKPTASSLTLTPSRAAIVAGGALTVQAATDDPAGVAWAASGQGCSGAACGAFSQPSSLDGAGVSYTAPAKPGTYTLTATSKSNASLSASAPVFVSDLAGVTTYHNDLARDGVNDHEFALSPSTVTDTTFGKLFSCTVDGAINAQPLWMPVLPFAAARHNAVFVATEHDSLYAFDADAAPCVQLWHADLLDAQHGGQGGETPVISSGPNFQVGQGFGDMSPEAGVTGTPVIDPSSHTIYVVSKSVGAGANYYQRLHAIDLLTGQEKARSPVTIAATYPGSADGGTTVSFDARQENQRAALALVNGIVYIAWASHEDVPPYFGWVIGYRAADLSQVAVFNDAPDAGWSGIWMSGGAPAADDDNHLYLITGNGAFDANRSTAPNHDYGDSFLKLSSDLGLLGSFTPSDEAANNATDSDLGAGGTAVLIQLPSNGAHPTRLLAGGGKDHYLYLLNADNLGGYGDDKAVQRLDFGNRIYATAAFWNSTLYLAGAGAPLTALALDPGTSQLNPSPASTSPTAFGWPGATPSVSSSGNSNGIVWAIDSNKYCTHQSSGCAPAVLHAYDATNLSHELWNSGLHAGDAAGFPVKFGVPTIANGRVYVGTRGNNRGDADTSTSIPGELDVYGIH